MQEEFITWKKEIKNIFNKINSIVKEKKISICEYNQIFCSDWYKKEGFIIEHELSINLLLPNEDFEIVFSSIFLKSEYFITNDDNLLWRGRLSLGLNVTFPIFCCVDRFEEALKNEYNFSFYRKK